jgi:acyl-CoA reductase-like NAD-dependent aldehyde dehydrogenase
MSHTVGQGIRTAPGPSFPGGVQPEAKHDSLAIQPKRELRAYPREPLNFHVCSPRKSLEIAGHTENISPGGLRLICHGDIAPGTPMAIDFAFGETCHLNLVGQVVYCQILSAKTVTTSAIGVKFSAIREWERKIIASALEELKKDATAEHKSTVTISVSKDALALEVRELTDRASAVTALSLLQPGVPRPTDPKPQPLPFLLALPTYSLLINGENVDTYRYRYLPYAEKLIADYKAVAQVMKQLKAGEAPRNYRDYIFARYCTNGRDSNLQAMQAAHRASEEFRYFPIAKRLKITTDIYDLLLAKKNELIELMVIEGHPRRVAEWEFLGMEQAYRKQSLDFYTQHLNKRVGTIGEEEMYWKRHPDGVVCVNPPRNAPCSSSLIAGFALLAGNTLVIKPPLRSPVSTLFLWKNIVQEALVANGAPSGTLNVVVGNAELIIDEWMESPYVNDIIFIGDSTRGLEIGNRAFQNGKKPILELSGNDMMFIWKDAAIDEAAASLLDGFLGSMQICMVPKKAFIHEDIYDEFVAAFLAKVKTLKIGLPSDPGVTLSPVIKIGEFYEFLDNALQFGAKVLCGGIRVDHNAIPDEHGGFITPTVIGIDVAAKAEQMRCIKEENFFPLMPLVKVSGKRSCSSKSRDIAIFTQMRDISNKNEYGLRTSAWVSSPFYIRKFMDQMHNSGMLRINCRHVGFSPYLASHGGTRKSGGPGGGMNYVWETTTHLQGVSLRRIQPLQ